MATNAIAGTVNIRQEELMAVIGVDYDEFEPETYRGVYVHIGDIERVFSGGTPTEDFRNAVDYCIERELDIVLSSSVDSFIMDGGRLEKGR